MASQLNASDSTLRKLSDVAGVDLISLKEKYTQRKSTASNDNDRGEVEQRQASYETLDKYSICSSCNGLGVVKTIYNHMVLEKECERCEGECILLKKQLNALAAELEYTAS